MNKIEKEVNIQSGYTSEDVMEHKALKAKIFKYLTAMRRACKKNPDYSVNLTKVLQKDFKLSYGAARSFVTKAINAGLIHRIAFKNRRVRFVDDKTISERIFNNLFKVRYVKVQPHKSIKVPDDFEIEVVKNDNDHHADVVYSDQDLITDFVHSDIYKALKNQGFDIRLSKSIIYNV